MSTTLFTEAASAKRLEKQLDVNILADVLATNAAEKDAAGMNLNSSKAQSNNNLAQVFALLAEKAANNDAMNLLKASRMLVNAMPEKAATANSSSLFGGKTATTDANAPKSTIGFTKQQ